MTGDRTHRHSGGHWFRHHQVVTRILSAVILVSACSNPLLKPDAPLREQYIQQLQQNPTIALPLADAWQHEGRRAMAQQLPIALPYRERQQLDPMSTQASVFRFSMQADHRLEIRIDRPATTIGGLIIDLMHDDGTSTRRIAALSPDEHHAIVRIKAPGQYRLRSQSVHGSAGPITLTLSRQLPLQFPVQTARRDAVQSLFGAERDAGRRSHHGIDIFAERHTPVLAASSGTISRVGETPRGGLHIWQSAPGTGRLYYAHLESAVVVAGDTVERGQIIGTVGNSGNAITTRPHLHFGVYAGWSGPVDPLPLVGRFDLNSSIRSSRLDDPPGPMNARWLRVDADRLNLRSGPNRRASRTGVLERGQLVQVRANLNDWLRVVSSDGQAGYVSRNFLGAPQSRALTLDSSLDLFASPNDHAALIGRLDAGTLVADRGQFNRHQWIETADGFRGWRRLDAPEPSPSQSGLSAR